MILLPHYVALAHARSYLAALADHATTIDASSAYEHALIELDRVHGDHGPAIENDGVCGDRALLFAMATNALEDLGQHGVDALSIELIIAMLEDAHTLDGP